MSVVSINKDVAPARAVPSQFRRAPVRDVYTVAEVAQRLGLSLGGAYELVREGTIPARKLGSRWVIPKERFHAWLNDLEHSEEPADVSAMPPIPGQRRVS